MNQNRSLIITISWILISMGLMAFAQGSSKSKAHSLGMGPSVIPLLLQDIELDELGITVGSDVWFELEYCASPQGKTLYDEPGEKLWWVQDRPLLLLGSTGAPLNANLTSRVSAYVRIFHGEEQIEGSPFHLEPRKNGIVVVPDAKNLQKSLGKSLSKLSVPINGNYIAQVANYLANNLATLDIQGTSYSVGGNQVINESGQWVGRAISWNNLAHIPSGFADGVDDTGSGTSSSNSLDASDGSPTNAVFVDENGNVGVGTETPQTNLHIHEDDNPAFRLTNSTTGSNSFDGSEISIYSTLTGLNKHLDIINHEQADIRVYTGGSLKMKIQNDGNVGIGVVNPSVKLEVGNTTRVTGYTVPTTGVGLELGYDPYSAGGRAVMMAWDRDSGETKPIFFGGSKVGIGNGIAAIAPHHALSVHGDASVTGDYKYYTLRTHKQQFPPSAFIAPEVEIRIYDSDWTDAVSAIAFEVDDFLFPDWLKDPVNYESDHYVGSKWVPLGRLSQTNYWTYRTFQDRNDETVTLPISVFAPVDLPNGAEIISITGRYYSFGEVKQRSLALMKRSIFEIGEEFIAIAASTSNPGRGMHYVSTTNIKPGETIIDNDLYVYALYWQSKYDRFFGATIEYQVDHVGN